MGISRKNIPSTVPASSVSQAADPRPLNWYGWSIETIAAVYESDAAAREAQDNPENESLQQYWVSAWQAEGRELELDRAHI